MRKRWRPALLAVCAVALVGSLSLGGVAFADDMDTVDLEAEMTGAQEVPADPDGRGEAKLELVIVGGQVCFELEFEDIGAPNRAHIHRAPAGVNGPIVVPFFELAATPRDPRHDQLEMGEFADCVTADPALLSEIAANPAGFYVNLHNARFPGGTIRGQLEMG